MRTIFAEYNPQRNSIDIYTNVGYMLRIDCWNMQDYILMEIYRCGLMQKIHLNFNISC